MVGIIVYIYFLILGFLYADILFKNKDIFTKLWLGGITGNLILMVGIVPIAFIFKFGIISHIILIVLAAVPYVIVSLKKKELCIIQNKKLSLDTDTKKGAMNMTVFMCLVVPIALIICVLMFNHILYMKDGNAYTGQCTYGDLQMHMDIISSLSEQHAFPPEYNIMQGAKLCYPFFIDMLSASLCIFGTSIRWAMLIPSFIFAFMVVSGFYFFAYSLTGKKSVASLAAVLFFFNGAFGFAYFLDGAKADVYNFTRIFTGYYQTPTNLPDYNLRWVNTISDMIIPQRTTMAGWTYVLCALWLLREALSEKKLKTFIYLGVLAGCMPMIHTHSFTALGIISAVAALYEIAVAKDKKAEFKLWLFYGGIAVILALPQMLIWTFNQAGSEGFIKFHAGWVNEKDPFIWFWIKNWGLVFLLAIPAFFNTSKINKTLMSGAVLVFIVASLVQFQPLDYDNNKLYFIAYMICIVTMTELFYLIYEKLKGISLRQYIAALVIITCTLSGVLTVIRELKSGGAYQIYSKADLDYAEFIKENTEPDALFMTGTHHLNPVTAIAGRSVYVGAGLFLNFHGFGEEYNKREEEIKEIYSANQEKIKKFAEENNIAYISVTGAESNDFDVNTSALEQFEKVYDQNGHTLYKVK